MLRSAPVFSMRTTLTAALLIIIFFSIFLGSRPLSVPDEGRYVEISREMAVTGDWITPRLNGVKYFEKPPLFYWIEACIIKFFGLSEWSVRIGPAFFALLGCFFAYFAGARLFGKHTGILSAGILATSVLYYALSRLITLDMPVTFFITASLLSFLLSIKEPEGAQRNTLLLFFYVFAALAVMTKGLIGIVLPAAIIGIWMLVTGEWRMLHKMLLLPGILIFFVIAAPWHFLVNNAHPEFFDFYFVREHFQRYLTTVHHHYKPFWFFLPVILLGFFPWSAFLIQAIRHSLQLSWNNKNQNKETIFLLIWGIVIFLFFSASSSKLIPYILPAMPPFALIIGKYLAVVLENRKVPGFQTGFIIHLFMSILLSIGFVLLPRFRQTIGHAPNEVLLFIASVLLLSSIAALVAAKTSSAYKSISILLLSSVIFFTAANKIIPAFDTRSVKTLAQKLKQIVKPSDEVAAFRTYYQDLPVYLERTITVVDWTGEMEFGASTGKASGWMINETEFWKRWHSTRTVFVITSKKIFESAWKSATKPYFPVAEDKNNVILSNRQIQ